MAEARELKDVVIDFVSLVDKAANKRRFLFAKREEAQDCGQRRAV